ncbi:cadmium transporter [Paenibacillus sp. FSL H8-0548]|uniref:heavy metal translocating P-type ATPase n=1 Tax=Paenibacillus sp. FSL H8-0548 TaxID=1920422 RepID=UPI00096ED506|nr:heavy metal translocating P-type ATPase [Paenibacillus sp. FSL H8-0548]OMF24134.1 cadmium transporter [Paenibacillus sp. FSL H8-0548]
MNEFRIKGLSCAGCAQRIEDEIKQLEHGADAKLSYNSGKLTIDPRISMPKVNHILKSDGAYIASSLVQTQEHSHSHEEGAGTTAHSDHHGHDHDHSHADGNNKMLKLLITSGIIYAAALLLEGVLDKQSLILLYLTATIISGYTTFFRGLKNLSKFKFNMDTLMTIALVGAVAIGEWKEATLVAILFGLNELLEGFGMEKARRSMEALLKVAPKEAVKIINGKEVIVPISSLQVNDLVKIKPGEKIPSDGVITDGNSSVNESPITGESLPVEKERGEPVYGGSINNEGLLWVRIEKAYKDSSLAKILHLVQEAQETKTPTELYINKFSKYYTPLIMLVAVLVVLVPPLFFQGDWQAWLYQGLSVLIVGCPCALILSSPIAIVSGITRNARNGVLIKGGVFLEQLGKIDTLAFDKTGTLTKGEPHVAQMEIYDDMHFFKIAGAIEKSSLHPLAQAIMKEVTLRDTEVPEPDGFQTIAGQGIKAQINGKHYSLGNEKSIEHITIPLHVQQKINALKEEGLTLVIVADEIQVLGMFGIADEIRDESRAVIQALHKLGIKQTVMLTGDHQKTAEKVAAAVGVSSFYGNLLPEDKVKQIKKLTASGHVAMIGDGINDAPALASAQLGIAMGKGTDSAIETADIVLMQDHLGKLPEAVSIAKRVNRIIKFNISISLGLKIIALLLTIPGWLTLWIAILSDMGATIFVTLVSLTLLIEPRKKH